MGNRDLGPVHTVIASANKLKKAPIWARDHAKAGRLGEEGKDEWRLFQRVTCGLRPKRPWQVQEEQALVIGVIEDFFKRCDAQFNFAQSGLSQAEHALSNGLPRQF